MNLKKTSKENSNPADSIRNNLFIIAAILAFIPISIISGLFLLNTQQEENSVCGNNLNPQFNLTQTLLVVDAHTITLEVADTEEERSTGLMCRTFLSDTQGMLFIFEEETPLSFWMKNTLISLDIIFLDQNKNVINIHKNTTPNNEQIFYRSLAPAKFVVELKSGSADRLGIKAGQRLDF